MSKRLLDIFKAVMGAETSAPLPFVSAEFLRRYGAWADSQVPAAFADGYLPRITIIAPDPSGPSGRDPSGGDPSGRDVSPDAHGVPPYPHVEVCAQGAQVQGEYVLYAFAGDVFAPDLLWRFAAALNCPHKPDLLFADEDYPQGDARCPVFKCALNETNLLSFDCIGRPLLVSRALFRAAGPMQGFTDAHAYDYALRCAARCAKPQHIEAVLLHRAKAPQLDPLAARAALDGYLARQGQSGYAVSGARPGTFRIRLREKDCPEVGIVIPNKNNALALRMLLESIEQNALYPRYRILIVDYGSEDLATLRYYDLLQANKAAQVLHLQSGSLAALWNLGARRANTPLLLFMKPGVEVLSPAFLMPLMELALRPGAGAVGCLVTDAEDRPLSPPGMGQDLYDALFFLRDAIHAATLLRSGALMLRSDVFFDAGGFDETFVHTGSDLALCATLSRRGRVNAFTPGARIMLRESREETPDEKDKMRLTDALRPLRQGDPCLSGLWEKVWAVNKA